jgi:hypothetical protein
MQTLKEPQRLQPERNREREGERAREREREREREIEKEKQELIILGENLTGRKGKRDGKG